MRPEKPLVNKKYLLEKYPGKGGWTYAAIPEVLQDKHAPFGWVKVKGQIDNFVIKNYKLIPMGTGKLFLPVKSEIRKKINKQAGDWVHVILYADNDPLEIPDELLKEEYDLRVELLYLQRSIAEQEMKKEEARDKIYIDECQNKLLEYNKK